MPDSPDLTDILDRLLCGKATEAEIEVLRRSLCLVGNTLQDVIQRGKLNSNAGSVQAGELQYGDRIYQGIDATTLKEILREVLQPAPAAAPTRQKSRVVGLAQFPSVPVWVGRDALVRELQETLLGATPPQAIALIGQGGIGKTSLALKLLEALGVEALGLATGCRYDRAIAIRAEEGMSFDQAAATILSGLEVELPDTPLEAEQKIGLIVEGLAQERCLLLLDNLETLLHPASHPQSGQAKSPEWGRLLNALANANHRSQVVLTSRERLQDLADGRANGKSNPRRIKQFDISGIANADSFILLREGYALEDSDEDLQWVAEKVEGHVLLLELLAAIATDQPGYLRQHPELVTTEAAPILREQLSRQPAAAQDLLKRMGVLRYPIDTAGLTFLRLYTDNWLKGYRFKLAAKFGKPAKLTPDELAVTQTLIEQLHRACLVQRRYDGSTCQHFYDLHRVVVEFLQADYADDQPNLLKTVYRFYCTGKTVENPRALDDLRPTLEAQYFAFQLGNYSEAFNLLANQLYEYLKYWGFWTLLHDLYEQILPHVQKDDWRYRDCVQSLGILHRDWGNWDKAEQYFQKLLSNAQEHDSQIMLAASYGLLGDIERNRGHWDAAEALYRKSLEIEEGLGDRSGMASSYGLLGDIERNRGNWDAAEVLYRKALEIREGLGDRSGMAYSYGSLGEAELGRGNLDEAETFLVDALQRFQELGNKQYVGECSFRLAQVWQKRGNLDQAQTHYNTAQQVFQQLGAMKELERIEQEWKEGESA